MRKGISSLYGVIKTSSKISALSGDAFVFIGCSQKSVKILRWHKDGFLLYHKRLELGRYSLPCQKGDEPFFELKTDEVNKLVGSVKSRSAVNELKREIILTL